MFDWAHVFESFYLIIPLLQKDIEIDAETQRLDEWDSYKKGQRQIKTKMNKTFKRTTVPSAGRDQKMQTLAECGLNFLNFIFLAQAYHGKFQSSIESAKICPIMAIFSNDLLHHTVHYPTKLQADLTEILKEFNR